MKFSFGRSLAVFVTLSLASLTAHAADPGYVDVGKFKPTDGCQFVEVNLHAAVLNFASKFVDKDEPEIAALIRNIKHVRVNVVGYNESTRAENTGRVEGVRQQLESQGWAQMVTVKQGQNSGDVAVFVKMAADESIEGVVVTVVDTSKNEVVFVNLVGNIKPEQIAMIGKRLNIDPLSQLAVKMDHKSGS